ncbi:MAG: hypothetical protein HN742_27930 [Lentisphaerae bacterium]|jgi:hypothetical protein|nr:hypothetical protein [Lentisphaerota bacterium]MBT4814732.1 hypothetical protein [Lentisphaerota bacterium]MBT5609857.1 hypothetical protein [Lentisphaerota bacterium]MBT7056520.1 hypothetical protein [Lentisphaerota bacterium]MBT7845734.1 hypothetical protein [Lentisphaerota bacterium]
MDASKAPCSTMVLSLAGTLSMWLLCSALLAWVPQSQSAEGIVFLESFSGFKGGENAEIASEGGPVGAYVQLRGITHLPVTELQSPLSGDYTLSAWIRASEWLEESPGGFGQRTPPTIMALYISRSDAPVVFRVCRRSLQLAVNRNGRWDSASGWHQLPAGEWIHAAVVRQGPLVRFFLNGIEELSAKLHRCAQPLVSVRVATIMGRTFFGDVDEATVWNRALSAEEIAEMVPATQQRRVANFPVHTPAPRFPAYPGRELRVEEGDRSPVIGGLSAHALPLPWYGAGRTDLLCHGVAFNAHPTVHRQLENGTYSPGVPLESILSGTGLPEPPYFRLDRADGLFDLVSTGRGTPLGDHLVHHRNTGVPGKPSFAPPKIIRCDGTAFRHAYHASLAALQDIDGDGVPDLLLIQGHRGAPYTPDHPNGFWTGREQPSTGKGRGYSINGRWLGHEGRYMLHWVRGHYGQGGALEFGKRLPIVIAGTGFPLQWKGLGGPKGAWLRIDDADWLVLHGSIDRILAVPATLSGDTIHCGPPRDLLGTGSRLRSLYYPHAMQVCDTQQDGRPELLLCGNPGVVVILEGTQVGGFRERILSQTGGALAMETLIVPCREDWDADGHPDLIAGDASGWLKLWPGTRNPIVYRSPMAMATASGPVHSQAGYGGSIQGPNEARWGYLNPTVGDWDLDGKLDIVTCDINADMLWYRPGPGPGRLADPVAFTHSGTKLRVAWRQRPAILAPTHRIATERPVLLHMNWDGILSLGIPDRVGTTELAEIRPLQFTDGNPVKLDGPGGLWGRAKFATTDWDADGVWDVIFGTNRSDHAFFSEKFKKQEATPFLLRNAGTSADPVFERPQPIKLGDVDLAFGTHIAAVYATDLDGDGRSDLIVGAEDGRVYHFLRHELSP